MCQLCRVTHDLVGGPRGDQPLRATQACARGVTVSTSIQGDSGPCPRCRGVELWCQATRAWSGCTRGRPAFPCDSSPGPRSHEVDQLSRGTPRACGSDQISRATRTCVQGPAGSTSCPRRLGPGSEGLRGRPAVSGESHLGPRAHEFNQLSPATRSWVRGHAGSTRCHRPLGSGSEGPQG